MAIFKGQDPIFVIERRMIEGRTANAIAHDLVGAFQKYCSDDSESAATEVGPNDGKAQEQNEMPNSFRSIL